MSLRDDLLPVAALEGILGDGFGMRRSSLTIRQRTWSGTALGLGAYTDVDLVISPRPEVRPVTIREIASSGGTLRDGDYRVSGITPSYAGGDGGGYTPAQLRPVPANALVEIFYILTDDAGPANGTFVEGTFGEDPFEYSFVVRRRRDTP